MHMLAGLLQGVENTLAQERKARSPIAHPLDEFQFVHFSLDDPIAGGPPQASLGRLFVSYHSGDKALELTDLAFFDTVYGLPSSRRGNPRHIVTQKAQGFLLDGLYE